MRITKKITAYILATSLLLSGITFYNNDQSEVKAAVGDWKEVWSDEFNGTSLDTNTWTYEIGNGNWGWGNGEAEYYTDRPENISVSDGYLKITAKKENYKNFKYTSGRIISRGKKNFKYGKMEARIKVENGNQSGVWPAFWMMGEKGKWPDNGELDIMEHANDRNYVGGCIHWNPNGFGGNYDHRYQGGDYYFSDNVNNGITNWHTYGIIWDEKHIEWTVDGVSYHTEKFNSSNSYCFQQYQYFLLNLAIGGTGTLYTGKQTPPEDYKTAVMYVDWVKVWQKEEAPTTEYDGPYVTVTEDSVAKYTGSWSDFFGNNWTGASGTLTSNGTIADGFTINATSVGRTGDKDSIWGIQGKLMNLKYYPGNTYKYKCTITSDKDKRIFVKVADDAEDALAGGYITLKANEPYYYETDVNIPKDFDGTVSLKFGMGIANDGDVIDAGSSLKVKVENVSFVTTATIPDPDYVNSQTTTEKPTVAPTVKPTETTKKQQEETKENITEVTTKKQQEETKENITEVTTKNQQTVTTTKNTSYKVTKPGKTKVVRALRSKNNKKISLKLKKIKGASKYEIKVSTSKRFTKKTTKKVVIKSVKKVIRGLKKNKKYYIKARAIKVVNKKLYPGKWSKVKTVKLKK